MLKNLSIYSIIGVFNTFIHWAVFYILYDNGINQSYGNFIAFIFSATLSFFINAKLNFKSEINKSKYLFFLSGMGFISFSIGIVADYFILDPLVTLILFSGVSFLLGFLYSKYYVFR